MLIQYNYTCCTYHGVELDICDRALALKQLERGELVSSVLVPVGDHAVAARRGEGVEGVEVQRVHTEDVRAVPVLCLACS